MSMTKISHDDILEGLYKLRKRESDKLKTVLELYDLEIHQKKIGPDCHRLKTMVKRSIEQDIRNKNFGARNGNCERNTVVKNPGDKTAWTKKSLRLLAMGSQRAVFSRRQLQFPPRYQQTCKNDTAEFRLRVLSCNRMREMRREPEVPEERVPVVECLDGPARITLKELATTHFVKGGTLQNACSTRPRAVANSVKSAHMHIARLMNNLLKGPKRMMTKVQSPC